MLKNYLLTTVRNVLKYRGFSIINILGLASSMAICLIIILFVRQEASYDQFHSKKDRIYRVNSSVRFTNGTWDNLAATPAPLIPVLRQGTSAIEDGVRLTKFQVAAAKGDQRVVFNGLFAEPNFFAIFDFDLEPAGAALSLAEPFTMAISAETARSLFGEQDPIGQTVTMEKIGDVRVAAIIPKSGGRTHLAPYLDGVLSFATLSSPRATEMAVDDWEKSLGRYYSYVLLREGGKPDDLQAALGQAGAANFPNRDPGSVQFYLQRLTDMRHGPNLSNKIERQLPPGLQTILILVAIVVISMACFNYINLSVARSLKRAQEVGIRKVSGALRTHVVLQFLGEAVIMSWIALVLAVIFLDWLIPLFNRLWLVGVYLQASISFDMMTDLGSGVLFFAFATAVGVIAGIYPAWVLSSYAPTAIFQGLLSIKGYFGRKLRNVLIVAQFSLSIVFIVSMIFLSRQTNYLINADYGFNSANVLNVNLQGNRFAVVRDELLKHPSVHQVSGVSILPGTGDREREKVSLPGIEEPLAMTMLYVDGSFIENLSITFVAGDEDRFGQGSFVVVNEAAIARWGLLTPHAALGQAIEFAGQSWEIAGVVRNFYALTLGSVSPLVMVHDPARIRYANLGIAAGSDREIMDWVSATWNRIDPVRPLSAGFYDQQLAAKFSDFSDYLKLITAAEALIIFIACLGLFGLAAYDVESRMKEVGIRKVMGASTPVIFKLLLGDFVKIMTLAALFGAPVAWYLNKMMLQGFPYRIELDLGTLALGIVITAGVAFLTIVSLTLAAARSNPIHSLRYE